MSSQEKLYQLCRSVHERILEFRHEWFHDRPDPPRIEVVITGGLLVPWMEYMHQQSGGFGVQTPLTGIIPTFCDARVAVRHELREVGAVVRLVTNL